MAESAGKGIRCPGLLTLPEVSTALLTFLSRSYLERLGRFPDGPGKEVVRFNEDIPLAPFKSTFKKILTADLLAVKSVAYHFRETGQTIDFCSWVYKA